MRETRFGQPQTRRQSFRTLDMEEQANFQKPLFILLPSNDVGSYLTEIDNKVGVTRLYLRGLTSAVKASERSVISC
jgi:hypothetical protein